MQYNPSTKNLWDDDGNFLKRVHCPKAASRDQFADGHCQLCDHEVIRIDQLNERDVLKLFNEQLNPCVSFRLDSPIIRIIPYDPSQPDA